MHDTVSIIAFWKLWCSWYMMWSSTLSPKSIQFIFFLTACIHHLQSYLLTTDSTEIGQFIPKIGAVKGVQGQQERKKLSVFVFGYVSLRKIQLDLLDLITLYLHIQNNIISETIIICWSCQNDTVHIWVWSCSFKSQLLITNPVVVSHFLQSQDGD